LSQYSVAADRTASPQRSAHGVAYLLKGCLLGHHFRDVPIAERKSKIKPSAMTDDHGGKAVTAAGWRLDGPHVHSAIEHESA
jgi:hypothetical protein